MKLSSFEGKGSGKVGGRVYSVNGGAQIVREYTSKVSNPSTSSQVNVRAKFKLMSQIAAAYADVIAISRKGMETPRNQFVSKNFPLCTADNGIAVVPLEQISLTKSGFAIPGVVAERIEDTSINVALNERADQLAKRIVYVMFKRTVGGDLMLVDSAIVEEAGADGTFPIHSNS